MYAHGDGVSQDYEEAVKWYQKAAEQGNARAQGNLGVMYNNGTGVPRDYEKAAEWYQKAAEQGNANAEFNLRKMYSERDDDNDNYSFSDYIADNYDGNYQMFEDNFPYND